MYAVIVDPQFFSVILYSQVINYPEFQGGLFVAVFRHAGKGLYEALFFRENGNAG